jgi:hypothetical protein
MAQPGNPTLQQPSCKEGQGLGNNKRRWENDKEKNHELTFSPLLTTLQPCFVVVFFSPSP